MRLSEILERCRKLPIISMGAWLAIAVGLLYLYGIQGNTDQPGSYGNSAFGWMVSRWNWSGADMSHAWLVPCISVWALWFRRKSLLAERYAVDQRGLILIVFSLLMYLAGIRTQQTRIVLMSFVVILWGIPFYYFGWGVARILFFPCAYLTFCIPFTFLDDLTLPLRLISTSVSSALLNGFGISVTRIGTAFHVNTGGGFSLDVAHPCSGLRYLVAMIALTTAYAYFTQRGVWRRVILSVVSIPLAMIGNIVRIFLIAVVGVIFGQEMAVGFYHDYSGYVVFAVATLLMLWIGGLLQRGCDGAGGVKVNSVLVAQRQEGQSRLPPGMLSLGLMVFLLSVVICCIPRVTRVDVVDENSADVNLLLPEYFDDWRGTDVFYCQNDQCARAFQASELNGKKICPICAGQLDHMALGERTLLPADTLIARKSYINTEGAEVMATIVLTGRDQRSIHRPQQCLPAQGFAVDDSKVLSVKMSGDVAHKMTVISASSGQRSSGPAKRMVLAYWFSGGGHMTHDHLQRVFWMAWDNLILGRRARWAYVSLQTTDDGSSRKGERTLADFDRAFYPLIQRNAKPMPQ